MHTPLYSSSTSSPRSPAALLALVYGSEPLICAEKIAEHVGDNPETQRQVMDLCLRVLAEKRAQLRRAINQSDQTTIQSIAHYLRGSLGMLGLPDLLVITEDLEIGPEALGLQPWHDRCEQFCALLKRVQQELRHLRVA